MEYTRWNPVHVLFFLGGGGERVFREIIDCNSPATIRRPYGRTIHSTCLVKAVVDDYDLKIIYIKESKPNPTAINFG